MIVEFDPRIALDRRTGSTSCASRAGNGKLVPLSAFARSSARRGRSSVNQLGQLPAVTISFNLPPGVSLGDAVQRIDAHQGASSACRRRSRPPSPARRGCSRRRSRNQGLLLAAAVLTIYIVLGILYESFIHPLTILTGLPSAAVGALGALELFGLDLSASSPSSAS